jgi:hypothetical protein
MGPTSHLKGKVIEQRRQWWRIRARARFSSIWRGQSHVKIFSDWTTSFSTYVEAAYVYLFGCTLQERERASAALVTRFLSPVAFLYIFPLLQRREKSRVVTSADP